MSRASTVAAAGAEEFPPQSGGGISGCSTLPGPLLYIILAASAGEGKRLLLLPPGSSKFSSPYLRSRRLRLPEDQLASTVRLLSVWIAEFGVWETGALEVPVAAVSVGE
jgi:hypothetical protein